MVTISSTSPRLRRLMVYRVPVSPVRADISLSSRSRTAPMWMVNSTLQCSWPEPAMAERVMFREPTASGGRRTATSTETVPCRFSSNGPGIMRGSPPSFVPVKVITSSVFPRFSTRTGRVTVVPGGAVTMGSVGVRDTCRTAGTGMGRVALIR